jgi:hypothetical protein
MAGGWSPSAETTSINRVPSGHPLGPIQSMVDEALRALGGRFAEIYGLRSRKSISP